MNAFFSGTLAINQIIFLQVRRAQRKFLKGQRWCFIVMLALLASGISSCSKSGDAPNNSDYGNHPRSAVPQELVGGYFQAGSFSMSQYSNYDGSYAGQAFEISTGYRFVNATGDAEQYFYYTNTGYYCRDQILGFRKGTVVFDEQAKTFRFYAASGNYRRFESCGSSQTPGYGQQKQYGAQDLYPQYKAEYSNYSIVRENGKLIWRVMLDDNTAMDYEKSANPI